MLTLENQISHKINWLFNSIIRINRTKSSVSVKGTLKAYLFAQQWDHL
jgi:hypothetical protein